MERGGICHPFHAAAPPAPAQGRAGSARDGSDERRGMGTKTRCKTRTLVRDRRGIHEAGGRLCLRG
jgi:hypothetical protein